MARFRRLLALLALCGSLVAIAAIVRLSGSGSYQLTAVFDQVYGLIPGADVDAGGLRVGSVDSIWLGRDGRPHVRLSITDGYRLRAGASADVRAISLAGEVNRFVSVTQGTGAPLPDGATLGRGHTDQPVEVYQLLDMLDPRTRGEVRSMLAGLDLSVAGRGSDIRAGLAHSAAAIGNTAALLAEVNSDGAALRRLVRDGRMLVSTLAERPSSLGTVADRLAATLGTTARRQAQLGQTATLLAPSLGALQTTLQHLDGSVGRLETFVRVAQPGVQQLVPFANALAPALEAAPRALRSADRLVRAAPRDAVALAPLLGTVRPLLPVLERALNGANPILDQLRVRMPDLFSFFANWADFTADYDAVGHAARVGVVFPPPPTKPISPCRATAGVLPAPLLRSPGVLGGRPWTTYQKTFVGGGVKPAAETEAGC